MNKERFPLGDVLTTCRLTTAELADLRRPWFASANRHSRYEEVARWAANGLSERQADELAVFLGRHPGEIWPQWWRT